MTATLTIAILCVILGAAFGIACTLAFNGVQLNK